MHSLALPDTKSSGPIVRVPEFNLSPPGSRTVHRLRIIDATTFEPESLSPWASKTPRIVLTVIDQDRDEWCLWEPAKYVYAQLLNIQVRFDLAHRYDISLRWHRRDNKFWTLLVNPERR